MKKYILKHMGSKIILLLTRYAVECEGSTSVFASKEDKDQFVLELEEEKKKYNVTEIDVTPYISLENKEVSGHEEALSLFAAIDTLEGAKLKKIAELEDYDKSSAVNLFYLNNAPIWLDASTRIGLKNRIETEKISGKETTTLWIGASPVELPIQQVEAMLQYLEMYAIDCFDNTAKHKAAIMQLDSIVAVQEYDFTIGYPDKISL